MNQSPANHLISINKCHIDDASQRTVMNTVSWTMRPGEAWLVTGPNGGGKASFLNAVAGIFSFIPDEDKTGTAVASVPLFSSVFGDSVEIVSLERAAALIEQERAEDESEYLDGGVDIGRTGRIFI